MANVTSNLWWFVVTKTYKDIYNHVGPHVPFFTYGTVCLVGFVFIYVFLPETQGRSVEKTERKFNNGVKPILARVFFCCNNSSSSASRATYESTRPSNQ